MLVRVKTLTVRKEIHEQPGVYEFESMLFAINEIIVG